jgi:GNAT superfamily N-acetyltransferase
MSDFTIRGLTPETFDDFAALVERNKGMFASCWCTYFHPDCAEKGQSAERNRALKQRLVADGIAHAALVYDGDRVVAWAEYGSPEELPSIHHLKEYVATAERLPDYRVTCILVERGLRGQGLAATALRGAVELIARAGGGLVEGYPHDTGGVRKEELVLPLQRHPHDVRARGVQLRPPQGPGELCDGARGAPEHARLKRPRALP